MKKTILFLFIMLNSSCTNSIFWENYDESIEILQSKSNANTRMQFKLIQSKNEIKNEWFKNISKELSQFGEEGYYLVKNNYTWDDMVEKTKSMYENILSKI